MKNGLILQQHQVNAIDKISRPQQHGLLVYHGLGSGKTISSIMSAKHNNLTADVVVPASLRNNYYKEVNKTGENPKNFNVQSYEKFTNHTPDVNTPKMLIVDEAHRIKNSQTKRARAILDASKKYKKVMLLTGTPIQNKPYEIASLIDAVAGDDRLPVTEKVFNKRYLRKVKVTPGILDYLFKGEREHSYIEPKNLLDFRKKVRGLVDYHKSDTEHFPRVKTFVSKVMMNKNQEDAYRYYEKKLSSGLRHSISNNIPTNKKDTAALNRFLSATRQISNDDNKFSVIHTKPSPKIRAIARRIKNSNRPSLVYSSFLDSGIYPLSNLLSKDNVSNGVYTGKLSDAQKTDLVKRYNSGKLKSLLISASGGEGLDLKDTGSVHIMEPYWNDPRIQQVIGRAVRYKSHDNLPPEQREVDIYKYVSDIPNKVTADEYLYNMSKKKKQLNDKFLNILRQEGSKK